MHRIGCVFCLDLKDRDAYRLEVCFDQCLNEDDQDYFCRELNAEIVGLIEVHTDGRLEPHQDKVLNSAIDLLNYRLGCSIEDKSPRRSQIQQELQALGSITIPFVEGVPLISEAFHP